MEGRSDVCNGKRPHPLVQRRTSSVTRGTPAVLCRIHAREDRTSHYFHRGPSVSLRDRSGATPRDGTIMLYPKTAGPLHGVSETLNFGDSI